MTDTPLPDQAIQDVALLAEPVRRSLYAFVSAQADGAGRDAAADAAGVSRALAAFHLDRLVDGGLLDVSFRRLGTRRGPGAGRPAKIYRRSAREVSVSLPDRRYDVAAELLATALEGGQAGRLSAEARALGLRLGDEARRRAGARPSRARLLEAAADVLGERGYAPVVRADGSLLLRNCPFDALAQRHRTLVCGMNLSIMDGVLDGLRARGITATLDPQPGRCCVIWGPAMG